jgi:hypothetical protein
MNISKIIPGFHNGVSRQSPTMRLDTQVEEAENCLGSLVEGTIKRPNTDFVAVLSSLADGDVFIHPIVRDETEKFFLVITGDPGTPIEVFTHDGVKCTVQYGTLDESMTFTEDAQVMQYLDMTSGRAKNNYRAVTIADHTFIVNRLVYTDMGSAVSHSGGSLDGSVQSFEKLTDVSASEGEVWEVTGNDTNHFDNYYVQKQSGALWLETIAPNIPYQLEASLMPHRLVRIAENSFVFAPIEWGERTCGDDASAPVPSFIGKRITNIFFFRNRLGFLSNDNVVLSAASDYYRLFPQTALDVLDDDPIDLAASVKEVSTLHSVAGFNKQLLILGSPQQFSLGSGDNSLLTPATAALDGTTRFAVQPNCEPVSMGSSVYFANPREQHITIREYLVQENTLMEDAADITAHCPDYIPTGDITMCGISSMDMLFVHSSGDPNALYVYKFYWVGNEKAQSAWHRWTFDDAVLSIAVMDEALYIIFDGNETKLEKILVEAIHDGNLDFRCHLDHKVQMNGEWTGEVTRFQLPYTPQMGSLTSGGIDEHATLMLQSDNPPYIGSPIGGNDVNTLLLVKSNEITYSEVFEDSSEYERTLTYVTNYEQNPYDPIHHDTTKKKFGTSSIRLPHSPYIDLLTYPMEGTVPIDFSSDFTIDTWVYLPQAPLSRNNDAPWTWTGDSNFTVDILRWGTDDATTGGYFKCSIQNIGYNDIGLVLTVQLGHQATNIPTTQFPSLDGISGDYRSCLMAWSQCGQFPLNKWVHVAIERHLNHISIYQDGRKVGCFDCPGDIYDKDEQGFGDPGFGHFGSNPEQGSYYMDEYRVSGIARYAGHNVSVGAYWFAPEDFGYGETPLVYDRTVEDKSDYRHAVSFGNNAYHKNDDNWPVRFPQTSFYFDGVDGKIVGPDHEAFNFTASDFTIDWSVYFNSDDEMTFFSKWASDAWGWQLKWNGAGVSFEWSATGDDIDVGVVSWMFDLSLSTWYHFALVRHGEVMTLYVNGRSKGDRVFEGTVQETTAPLLIGVAYGDAYPFDGAMEEIRFSDIARWTSNFLPPLSAYTRDADGFYTGLNGGIPDGFDPSTMSETFGLQYLASYFGMEVVHPVTGLPYPEATIWGDEIYVRENVEDYTMIIGRNYTLAITLSPIYMLDGNGKSILEGRLQLRNMTFSLKDTGYFNFVVAPIGRSALLHTFNGVSIGSAIVGQAAIHSIEKRFPVMANSKGTVLQLTNETYLPCKFQSASYEATFTKRSKSV